MSKDIMTIPFVAIFSELLSLYNKDEMDTLPFLEKLYSLALDQKNLLPIPSYLGSILEDTRFDVSDFLKDHLVALVSEILKKVPDFGHRVSMYAEAFNLELRSILVEGCFEAMFLTQPTDKNACQDSCSFYASLDFHGDLSKLNSKQRERLSLLCQDSLRSYLDPKKPSLDELHWLPEPLPVGCQIMLREHCCLCAKALMAESIDLEEVETFLKGMMEYSEEELYVQFDPTFQAYYGKLLNERFRATVATLRTRDQQMALVMDRPDFLRIFALSVLNNAS